MIFLVENKGIDDNITCKSFQLEGTNHGKVSISGGIIRYIIMFTLVSSINGPYKFGGERRESSMESVNSKNHL